MKNRQSIPAQVVAPLMMYAVALAGPIFLSVNWQPAQPVEMSVAAASRLAASDSLNWVKAYREERDCSGHSLSAIWCED